uniref:Uncharacterized protein n=1 Tax=Eutreptiella gymnastica TaxID=73025 RepID=A0A7S1I1Z5_9EUGL
MRSRWMVERVITAKCTMSDRAARNSFFFWAEGKEPTSIRRAGGGGMPFKWLPSLAPSLSQGMETFAITATKGRPREVSGPLEFDIPSAKPRMQETNLQL